VRNSISKKHAFVLAAAAFMAGVAIFSIGSFGQAGGTGGGTAQGGGRGGRGGRGGIADPNAQLINLALAGTPSASYVSGDTTLDALNDGAARTGNQGLHYGNWPRSGTQWVEYTWPVAISTNKIDVIFWVDGAGIHLPARVRVKFWDGSEYVEVSNAQGLGVGGEGFNTTSFDEVTTTKIRLEMDAAGGNQISTGINEFRVYDSGKSPAFPPKVAAGVDRLVVQNGRTFLSGAVRDLRPGPGMELSWSKASGPGNVTFASAASPVTTATLDQPGDYVLALTARRGELSNSSTVKVKVVPPMPADALAFTQTNDYTLDSPLWGPRLKSHIVSWIPHCIEQIETPNLRQGAGGLDNFIDAARKLRGESAPLHRGYWFSNAWVYNILESMCVAQTVKMDDAQVIASQKAMLQTIDKWIPIILAAQEPDGYIQTCFTLGHPDDAARKARDPNWVRKHWSPETRADHEGYVMGYFLESAVAHFAMTKGADRRLYDAAKKCADCWVSNIGPEPGKKVWYDGHQEMEKALVRFGRLVNEVEGSKAGEKYIKLAKFLLDSRAGGSTYDQSHLPIIQQYEAVGHAVRASYTYAGMAAVLAETHDLDYQSATLSIWDNIMNKKYYLTGGIGSGETSEGFGPNYSLRNNAYAESCSGSGQLFFNYNLNLAYHDAKFVDQYEETLYNAILGDTNLAGTVFNYTNPLDSTGGRTAWHNCPCCVGNIPRTLLQLPTWTYATGADGLYMNLFVGSTMTVDKFMGTSVEMVQKTNYPWDGKVAVTVNPRESKSFALHVRVPDRKTSDIYKPTPEVKGLLNLAVNGEKIANPTIQNGYAVITRQWKTGDKIEFEVPMTPQKVKSIDQVAANRGRIAIKYGPLVYNIEAADGNNLNAQVDVNAPLTTEWRPDFLGGVMVIKGKFVGGADLLAIPNYARNNRQGRSIVWMVDDPAAAGAGGGTGRRGGGAGEPAPN
jgi:DUF1680 family protein